uniref:Uncharacterized protein n=1 Tax=Vespula pensylvanica TaxID=30213 RepID=A0A834U906_VESPE|nr:hypothetical protein H0235_010013 [Vespula pensylvanica]
MSFADLKSLNEVELINELSKNLIYKLTGGQYNEIIVHNIINKKEKEKETSNDDNILKNSKDADVVDEVKEKEEDDNDGVKTLRQSDFLNHLLLNKSLEIKDRTVQNVMRNRVLHTTLISALRGKTQ